VDPDAVAGDRDGAGVHADGCRRLTCGRTRSSRCWTLSTTAAVRHWEAGGWGIDALAGEEIRAHRDLDLAVDADGFDDCLAVLSELGYRVETDGLPLRIEVAADGDRWVDVHPVRLGDDGVGLQGELTGTHFVYSSDAFTSGRISDRTVGCLSGEQQRLFHAEYELRAEDLHDLRVLNALDS
jgi:lincosamide nucleotidyltransferase A/C/D/E